MLPIRPDLHAKLTALKKPFKIYADYAEDLAAEQFINCMEHPAIIQGALMPDTHAGYAAPIGSVLKSKDFIFPALVGYDIGCGMSAIKTTIKPEQLNLEQLKIDILRSVPIGRNWHSKPQKLPHIMGTLFATDLLHKEGRLQLGTLGGGNHFIEIGVDQSNDINIVIHSGSRNIGKKIAEAYMKIAAIESTDKDRYVAEFDTKNATWKQSCGANPDRLKAYFEARDQFVYRRTRARLDNIEGVYGLHIDSHEGKSYLLDMELALQFALLNREKMIENIIFELSKQVPIFDTSRFINRNHNHAELIDDYIIHRKGATHAENGMLGVIPGNMRDGSFIVSGKGNIDSMSSSSHGAGRTLSRRQAKDTLSIEDFHEAMKNIVTNHTDDTLDEAPAAYKNIFDVIDQQSDLIEVIDIIKPILNIKG